MHCGWDPHALLKEADVVLVVDCDVPWIPKEGKPEGRRQGDPHRPRSAVRALSAARLPHRHRAHRRGGADAAGAVAQRAEARRLAAHDRGAPRRRVTKRLERDQGARRAAASSPMPATITGKWLSACMNRLLDDNTILVNEYPTVLEEMVIREPGRYFGNPSAGGLGWGMGAALGAKLASPDKTVICARRRRRVHVRQPDRRRITSRRRCSLPVLFVIANNARWAAVHRSTLGDVSEGPCRGRRSSRLSRRSSPRRASSTCPGERRPRRARRPSRRS